MLGKILKYEFKSTARLFLPTYLATLAFALLSKIFGSVYALQNLWGGIFYGLIILIYAIVILMTMTLTFVLIVQRFHKNLLKDEGYLSHTLPVSVDTHIWGKVIPAVAWTVLSALVVCASILLLLGTNEMLSDISNVLTSSIESFCIQNNLPLWLFVAEAVVVVVFSLFSGILAFYSALAIGHLANSRRILVSIVAYFALSMVLSLIYSSVGIVTGNSSFEISADQMAVSGSIWTTSMISTTVMSLINSAIYYLITRYILRNRLNLE